MTDITWKDAYGDAEGLACDADKVAKRLIDIGWCDAALCAEHAATAIREQAERIAEFESQCESLADECKGLEAQLAAVSEAIGGSEYMDPPDGGDVSLAEQVGRMRAENVRLRQWQREMVEKAADKSLDGYRELASKCAALEAENERLQSESQRWKRFYSAQQWNPFDEDGQRDQIKELQAQLATARADLQGAEQRAIETFRQWCWQQHQAPGNPAIFAERAASAVSIADVYIARQRAQAEGKR